jgi:hypothetical protein
MFSLFTKLNTAMDLTGQSKLRNRDLPLQLQQPPLSQRLKRTTSNIVKILFISGIFFYVVIMSFGDGTHTKRALENFSIGDTWHATAALMKKNFNDKANEGSKNETFDNRQNEPRSRQLLNDLISSKKRMGN